MCFRHRPLSRKQHPKQYLPLVGDNTIFQETMLRLDDPENTTNKPLEIIEVQNDTYLGEDDIIRFEDMHGRVKG